jgi:predicted RNase H-like nuclease (RuvC/YqgF family)
MKLLKLIEKEKNALQSRLEKEFDRMTKEWEDKVVKIKMEEKRLKDRMQDMAEKNVALQRQVSHLNNKEFTHLKSPVGESIELKTRLMEAQNEIAELRQSLVESCQRAKEAEDNLQSIQRCYDEKEVENYALQGSVIRLQRMCNDQENIISGLRQAGLQDTPQEMVKNDYSITKPQQEELLSVSTASMTCSEFQDMENIVQLGCQRMKSFGLHTQPLRCKKSLKPKI